MQEDCLFPVPEDWTCSGSVSGKRTGSGDVSASLLSARIPGALPTRTVNISGRHGLALIDSGCSKSIVCESFCRKWTARQTNVKTVSGEAYRCDGVGPIELSLGEERSVTIDALVVKEKPLGFDLVLGMDGIEALGGVVLVNARSAFFGSEDGNGGWRAAVAEEEQSVSGEDVVEGAKIQTRLDAAELGERVTETEKTKGGEKEADVCKNVTETEQENDDKFKVREKQTRTVEGADFIARYDDKDREWTVAWKWAAGSEPETMKGGPAEYHVSPECREEYDAELQEWVANGWLQPYDEARQGPPKGNIPLMAVVNKNKEKVRPVLDFRQLNEHVDAHTADADVCADKLRLWRQQGTAGALIDLRKAYLQIKVEESLWSYQTVIFRGKRYSLTRLGFGINLAPVVLKKILAAVLSWDAEVDRGTSPFIDDIFVNESVVPAEHVEAHLKQYGLDCKPERLSNGARVLGLRVQKEGSDLVWTRDNDIGSVQQPLTKRALFSLCGRLVGHLPVCGWLRPATSFVKRVANATTATWDTEVKDSRVLQMVKEIMQRVEEADPGRGRWNVSGDEATVWVDASSLALGVAVEMNGAIVEDASWLRRDECSHINMAELDAALKGVNMSLQWGVKKVQLMADSKTVFHWLTDTLSGKARLKTKAAGEMLIRRRLETIRATVEEYNLSVTVQYVMSKENRADVLTRVPQRWLSPAADDSVTAVGDDVVAAADVTAVAAEDDVDVEEMIRRIHHKTGHPGVRRTYYFCRRAAPSVTKSQVRAVVRRCEQCLSIDPAPVQWQKGNLSVSGPWKRLSMDITHVGAHQYLTLVDSGPSRFAVWRQLRRLDSAAIIEQLEQLFCERGPPDEILTDNAASFRSRAFIAFAERWGVAMRFRSAHQPSGNGIAERCHRSIKRTVARTGCSVQEALYWHNVTPKDDINPETAPANALYRYEVRLRGIDAGACNPGIVACRFGVGDRVWVRDPTRRCDAQSYIGTVTNVVSPQTVDVDGIPRHVRDLRPVAACDSQRSAAEDELGGAAADEEEPWLVQVSVRQPTLDVNESTNEDMRAPSHELIETPELEQSGTEPDQEDRQQPVNEPLGRGRRVTRQQTRCRMCT
ncbi:uncharacterized protein LOC122371842 [Amphibalanus amphitrite]|uniref:uncharacterized protein LOC122371842 n=1 Tax=Amphibalanus amphitrite TaxID=1232801 RepID=UPI001C918E19|nr:uncharacterized protein LOC122371842 [Amphibalanus amphitrite]